MMKSSASRFQSVITASLAIFFLLVASLVALAESARKGDIVVRSAQEKLQNWFLPATAQPATFHNCSRPRSLPICDNSTPVSPSHRGLDPRAHTNCSRLKRRRRSHDCMDRAAKERGMDYVNADDAPQTAARFDEFDRWTTANHLRWQAVGLNIEPSLAEYAALTGQKGHLLSLIFHRAFDAARVTRARPPTLPSSRGYASAAIPSRRINVGSWRRTPRPHNSAGTHFRDCGCTRR